MAAKRGHFHAAEANAQAIAAFSHYNKMILRNTLILIFSGSLLACSSAKNALPGMSQGASGMESDGMQAGAGTPGTSLGPAMSFLSSDQLMGREAGTEGIEKAALFLESELRAGGIVPYFNTYRDTLSNFHDTAYNIVGIVEGNNPKLKNEYIIIGAHYDHIGLRRGQGPDSIANGANDNASGTVTVLEIAKYFGRKHSNGRSLIFAFFSAEEEGLLGSQHLAQRLKKEGLPLYLMLNFEMTGVPMRDKDYLMYVTGYDKSNLAAVCNKYAGENMIGFLPTAAGYGLFERSDNYPFHQQFDVPSQTFCTFDFTNFDQYHKVGDELQLMDLDHMAIVVQKMAPVIGAISNASREISYQN